MLRAALICLACLLLCNTDCMARSASSPRHTGLEPPGGPRQAPLPSIGYSDAYGYGLTDKVPENKKPRHRPRPGAYGAPAPKESQATLPDTSTMGPPVWKFR